jgi:hypothetical protein
MILSGVVAVQAAAAIVAGASAAPPPGPGPHPHYGQVARQVACEHTTNPAFCSEPGATASR